MIEARELRIGNWVKVNNSEITIADLIDFGISTDKMGIRLYNALRLYLLSPTYGVFISGLIEYDKIRWLKNIGYKAQMNFIELCNEYKENDFSQRFRMVTAYDLLKFEGQPIPLTPEILEKCGFQRATIGGYYKDFEDITVRLFQEEGFYSLEYIGTKIQYLHQLQNLYFALTSEELKVNI
jgi:hypothetical protein